MSTSSDTRAVAGNGGERHRCPARVDPPAPVAGRFYTGRPNPNIAGDKDKARNLVRRLAGIRSSGVRVVTRELRYHYDWGATSNL